MNAGRWAIEGDASFMRASRLRETKTARGFPGPRTDLASRECLRAQMPPVASRGSGRVRVIGDGLRVEAGHGTMVSSRGLGVNGLPNSAAGCDAPAATYR